VGLFECNILVESEETQEHRSALSGIEGGTSRMQVGTRPV
jgi:hypothetical protein